MGEKMRAAMVNYEKLDQRGGRLYYVKVLGSLNFLSDVRPVEINSTGPLQRNPTRQRGRMIRRSDGSARAVAAHDPPNQETPHEC